MQSKDGWDYIKKSTRARELFLTMGNTVLDSTVPDSKNEHGIRMQPMSHFLSDYGVAEHICTMRSLIYHYASATEGSKSDSTYRLFQRQY